MNHHGSTAKYALVSSGVPFNQFSEKGTLSEDAPKSDPLPSASTASPWKARRSTARLASQSVGTSLSHGRISGVCLKIRAPQMHKWVGFLFCALTQLGRIPTKTMHMSHGQNYMFPHKDSETVRCFPWFLCTVYMNMCISLSPESWVSL